MRRNALDDGPGIRTVVFFKGCPLRCSWCQNPETLSPRPQLQRLAERCAACGACVAACPGGIARPAGERPGDGSCRACGACVAACAFGARRIAGEHRTVAALVELLARDLPFYRRSGGGVTLSGGEPTLDPAFCGALAAALRAHGVRVLLETCGLFDGARVERHVLPHVDAVYFDLKLADDAAHRRHTGRGNARIHDNLGRLAARDGLDLLPRIPLIPGITDTADNLAALAALLRRTGLGRVAVLPYNPLWIPKRAALGLDLPYDHRDWMTAGEVRRCADVLREGGLEVVGGG